LIVFCAACSLFADLATKFSPAFSTNTEILWQASTNNLPKALWIYQRLPPKPFPATVISNAIVLASLQGKGFPKPSTNDFFIWEDKGPNYPGPIGDIFSITPKSGTISYWLPNAGTNTADIYADKLSVQRARTYATQLGVDLTQVDFKEATSHFNQDENGNELTNQLCGRGIFLSRKLGGFLFWSMGTEDENAGGFWIEFGSHGQIRAFSLVWPDLKRDELQQVADPQQIIACIKAQKTIVLPNANEETYFQRIKMLATAKTFTITKCVPYYIGGRLGETPTNDSPSEIIEPIAELEAIADFGNSNSTVKLLTPILSPEAKQVLDSK
jgi:hypothetical protein